MHAVRREHHAADRHLVGDVHARPRSVREHLRPALAHLILSGEPRSSRVDAHDVLVFGPYGHHAVEVAALERLIESVLDVLRGGENLRAHSLPASAKTWSTVISRMQRKCPS